MKSSRNPILQLDSSLNRNTFSKRKTKTEAHFPRKILATTQKTPRPVFVFVHGGTTRWSTSNFTSAVLVSGALNNLSLEAFLNFFCQVGGMIESSLRHHIYLGHEASAEPSLVVIAGGHSLHHSRTRIVRVT